MESDESKKESQSKKVFVFLESFLLMLLIVYIDYLSPLEVHLTVLLLIPIYFATWYSSFFGGLLISILSAFSLIMDPIFNRKIYPHLWEVFWNITVVLIFFLAFIYLLNRLKNELLKHVKMSHTDHLTGLLNTRAFFNLAEQERVRSVRQVLPLIICFLDFDNFKQINDHFGHMMGDELLMVVASVIRDCVRKKDIAVRLGGDEFAVLFPSMEPEDAVSFIKRLHDAVNQAIQKRGWGVTLSLGIATFYQIPGTLKEIIHQVDLLMYKAKKSGKNRIHSRIFGVPVKAQKIPS